MSSRRHTNSEIRAAIDALETRGWTINAAGSVTKALLRTKRLRHDPRVKNAEPRYAYDLDGRVCTISRSDLVAAKFGLVAANGQPDEAEVESQADSEPETQPVAARVGCDEAEVGLVLSFAPETQPVATQRGPCHNCGGFVTHIKYVGEPDEWKCVQCGRTDTPTRTLSPAEIEELRERRAPRGEASRTRRWRLSKADAELEELAQSSSV